MAEVATKRRKLDQDVGAEDEFELPEICTPDGLFNMVFVDGDAFPRFPVKIPPEEHIRRIRTMPMRQDDVIIAAFPASGTRWVREIVQMLTSGKAEYDFRSKEQTTIELNDVADMESILSPRVFNSHLFLRQLSNEIVTKRSRVVHVIRNPKDLVVSYYFHMRQMSLFQDKGFEDFAVKFVDSCGCQGTFLDYFTYLYEMMKWQRQYPEVPVFNIYYEDLQTNPKLCVQRLARFLELNHVTDAFCADVADQCAFHNLKEVSEQVNDKDHPSRIVFKDCNPSFFRKGEVGDWKNYFTMALSEHYDQVIEERLKCCGFSFQYTLQ